MDIGTSLKNRRNEEKITQTELARRTNISQQNISRWENNTHIPTIKDCIRLADYYNITLDELIDRIVYSIFTLFLS